MRCIGQVCSTLRSIKLCNQADADVRSMHLETNLFQWYEMQFEKRQKSAKVWTFWNRLVHLSSMEPEPCIDNDEIAYKCANIWYVFVTIFPSKSTITSCPTWIEGGLHGRMAQWDADNQHFIHYPLSTIHLDRGWFAWSDGTMRNTQGEVEGTRFSLRLFEPGGFVFIKQSLISGIFCPFHEEHKGWWGDWGS